MTVHEALEHPYLSAYVGVHPLTEYLFLYLSKYSTTPRMSQPLHPSVLLTSNLIVSAELDFGEQFLTLSIVHKDEMSKDQLKGEFAKLRTCVNTG